MTICLLANDDRAEPFMDEAYKQVIEPDQVIELDHAELVYRIRNRVDALNERERLILSLHFGLNGQEPMDLRQIGLNLNLPISRERVRQIEEHAFRKIRAPRPWKTERNRRTFEAVKTSWKDLERQRDALIYFLYDY